MDGPGFGDGSTAVLVDSLKAADRDMARAQARRARLMVEVADARKKADRFRIAELESAGADPRYRPGEFAATEIGLAVTTSKHHVERGVSMTRRLQTETPDVWDAWVAGDINELKALRVNHTLLRLVRDDSKRLLNMLVVPVAVTKTPELLGRWLNQFVAQVEPDESDERIRRSLEDRYVSVRPDLDGVSFLSACMSSLDAQSVDLLLEALAATTEPGDVRTKQQRRADVLVDLLLGRVSNGWHGQDCSAGVDRVGDDGPRPDECKPEAGEDESTAGWDDDDWDLPASAFRPDPNADPEPNADPDPNADPEPSADPDLEPESSSLEPRPRQVSCPGQPVPRVAIGVVVSVQSLLGFSDTPGQLADRSALVPAEVIRELAGQPGTLFYRLLTDPVGNLLDVVELGRFPSGKLAAAVRFRDGVCGSPICHTAAQRCDSTMRCRGPMVPRPASTSARSVDTIIGARPTAGSPRNGLMIRRSGPPQAATGMHTAPTRCRSKTGRPSNLRPTPDSPSWPTRRTRPCPARWRAAHTGDVLRAIASHDDRCARPPLRQHRDRLRDLRATRPDLRGAGRRLFGATQVVHRGGLPPSHGGAAGRGHGVALVGLADFADPRLEQRLELLGSLPNVTAVRQHLGWNQDDPVRRMAPRPDYLTDPVWEAGLARLRGTDLRCGLEVFAPQLADLAAVVRRHPDIGFTIAVLGWPTELDAAAKARWRADLSALSRCDNTVASISAVECIFGLDWDEALVIDWISVVVELFGTDRCMFGSHLPIDGLSYGFDRLYQAYDRVLAGCSVDERDAAYGATAQRWFRVPLP